MPNFGNLDWTDGQVSIPGIYRDLYYIPKGDISTWPTLPANPASEAEEVTYEGSFTLGEAKTWKKINCIDIKSPVTCEPQGEIRSQTFLNKLTVVTALNEEKATAFAKLANNTDIVYLVREKNSGQWRLIGNEMFQTNTRPMVNIGGDPTGEKGTTLEIEVTDPIPAPFYDGAIVTDDGDINPGT
jgi:hypothetical protein